MKIYKRCGNNYLAKIFFFFLDRDFAFLLVRDVENRFEEPKFCVFSGLYWIVRSVN